MNRKGVKVVASFAVSLALALGWHGLSERAQAASSGTGGGTGGGTVYFISYVVGQPGVLPVLNRMNSDGTGKTAVMVLDSVSRSIEPSRGLHGGHGWFLQAQSIAGQTYPNGDPREELFAVRDDGLSVQLTDQPDLQPFDSGAGFARWQGNDEFVSWIAARWVAGSVVAGRIYAVQVVFDGAGNVTGLAAPLVNPIVPTQIVFDGSRSRPDMLSHDWSPDGSKIVFDTMVTTGSPRQLFIANLAMSQITLLPTSTWAAWPVWSPDNTKIAFISAGPNTQASGSVVTISPTGTNQKTVVARTNSKSNSRPGWSATGSHLVFDVVDNGPVFSYDYAHQDIYRAKADGNSKANLTKDLNTAVFGGTPTRAVGWR